MNISDVARAAGVSNATVSRVLTNADWPMREETRQRVLDAIEALDFRPNDLARGLLSKKTRMVGLIVPDISNPYYPEISRGVEDVAASEEYRVILCNTDRRAEKSKAYIDALLQKRVDGIIVAGGGTEYPLSPKMFESLATKVVLVGRHNLPFPSVQVDNVRGAWEATTHLLRHGHRRIGFITGPAALTSVQDRLSGYRTSLTDHEVHFDERLVREGDFGEAGGYACAESLLREDPAPSALFAANDRMAIGAMAAAADLGWRIPADLAVVGFDDIFVASYLRPALTTVSLPLREIGVAAMRLLLRQLNDEPHPRTVWLSTRLVVRDSGPLPVDDGPGARASPHEAPVAPPQSSEPTEGEERW